MVIEKPTIIVTSIGRTGTKFFHTLFREIISDGTVLHEPDFFKIVRYKGLYERIRQIFKQIREVGAYNLVVRKALGQWSLVRISDDRLTERLSYEQAVAHVLDQRGNFVRSREGSIYVESNLGYYGLIDVLQDVFKHHRLIYIVRDGRTWVQSWMNWGLMHRGQGGMYGKGRLETLFGHKWPTAPEITGDHFRDHWSEMDEFEKLCWAWSRLNAYAIKKIGKNSNAQLYRFEDIFHGAGRYEHLAELIEFATTFPTLGVRSTHPWDGLLENSAQKSVGRFPSWDQWSQYRQDSFIKICAPLMQELNYGL